ncbi:MAG TPA: hypothetical protein PKE06_16150 [Flavilitoribacter sp.]|nr:hypothetical protein [Flavilitoribacter sp.]HMQ89360.1 hypothetical protein [Flavilitoribacter sp.]
MPKQEKDKIGQNNQLHRQLADIGTKLQAFWETTYPAMTPEQKKQYWIGQLKPGIDWERGQGGNPASLFDEVSVAEWQSKEPGFLTILAEIGPEIGLSEAELKAILRYDG